MAEKPAVARPSFEADDHTDDVVVAGEDESSPKGLSALARFEFESGKANEGTKILMVEWEERDNDEWNRAGGGEWLVQWEGKSTVLQVKDNEETHHRLYILLPYGVTIPPTITLTRKSPPDSNGNSKDADSQPKPLHIHPLPAIFPPSLGAFARTAGKKGVLHTIWAKKRLSVLQKEIDAETQKNVESVGLEMALQEKAWIEQNFGVGAGARPSVSIPAAGSVGPYPLSPTRSPTTPGGGRLAEKLKGLRVGTSAAELSTSRHAS
ncbi:MAG: hypothetical protein M1813_002642 [Trichoglossum hirsutum]|nr:MAG: hypothetical protein M1813_002642 [Trichoglossum hirsutum]